MLRKAGSSGGRAQARTFPELRNVVVTRRSRKIFRATSSSMIVGFTLAFLGFGVVVVVEEEEGVFGGRFLLGARVVLGVEVEGVDGGGGIEDWGLG